MTENKKEEPIQKPDGPHSGSISLAKHKEISKVHHTETSIPSAPPGTWRYIQLRCGLSEKKSLAALKARILSQFPSWSGSSDNDSDDDLPSLEDVD